MNYYKRHLGDYAKDTRHLSLAEHGAYCLLLDYYYSTEKPIPDDRCERIANAYADFEREAVRAVLREFFVRTDAGWTNRRADEVIAEAAGKSLKAKESALARWGKDESERNANASKPHSDGNASHKPLATKEQESKALEQQAARKAGSRFAEFWSVYPVKKGRADAEAKWKARKLDAIADTIIADVKRRLAEDRQWRDGYIPHGSTYVNGRGWEDAIEPGRTGTNAETPDYLVGAI